MGAVQGASAVRVVGLRPRRDGARLLLGFGIGGALTSIGVIAGLLAGVYADGRSTPTHSGVEAILPLMPLILLYLLQGTSQETLTQRLPAWVAIIGISALVTVLHSFHPVTMISAFLYAIFAGLVALQQGSLWLVVGIQAG